MIWDRLASDTEYWVEGRIVLSMASKYQIDMTLDTRVILGFPAQ